MQQDWPGWPPEDAQRYADAGYWAGQNFSKVLAEWAARGAHTALVDSGRRISYAELAASSQRVAEGLVQHGIGQGDRVILQLPNIAEYVVTWFALQHAGAIPVHAMPAHRDAELAHLAALSGAKAYIAPDVFNGFDYRPMADRLKAARAGADEPLSLVVVVGDPGSHDAIAYDDLIACEPGNRVSDAGAGAIALLLLSGGTTGMPKLIPRTHNDYHYNARQSAQVCGMDADTVFLAPLPIGFNYAWCCPGVLSTFHAGGTVVLTTDPSPSGCLELIAQERVTSLTLNPPLATLFLEELDAGDWDVSSVRVVNVGSARLSDAVAPKVGPAFGAILQQVFGMAEGLICYTRLDDPDELITTTQGVPMSPGDEVRVVGEDGRDVPVGEPGELFTRGPYTLRGYYRAPEHNRTAFTPDGFYRTGDVVRRLPSGHLIVVGRVKDHINRGGEKIPATEVEGHLMAHPNVEAAAVVGVDDVLLGEKPVAVVTWSGGAPPQPAQIATHLRERGLAAYKIPDQVVTVDDMPLTPVGKIDKAVLKARIAL